MLLTRSRLCPGASPGSSLHLHVLSTPPAFVLSQDQTLREELLLTNELICLMRHYIGPPVHRGEPGRFDGVLLYFWPDGPEGPPGSNLDAHRTVGMEDRPVRMLLSFQRPSRPLPPAVIPPGTAQLGATRAGNGV